MYGWCKLIEENENEMLIGYSWETDKSCDGRLIFNKHTKEMTVEKISAGADEGATSYLICPLRIKIRKGLELGKRHIVATG